MMTNKEKYPKTEDALAAFRKHKEEYKCDCTFDLWLKMPCDEEVRSGKAMMMVGLVGMALFNALSKEIFGDKDKEAKSAGDDSDDIECPFCHKKNGSITQRYVCWTFECPDCGAHVSSDCPEIATNEDAFRKWFLQSNKKQD